MTRVVIHLGEAPYRAACGTLTKSFKSMSVRTADVTCLRCPTTLKYKSALKREGKP